jgi:hypothetical protein
VGCINQLDLARVLDLKVRLAENKAIFEYEVTHSLAKIPCVLELHPKLRSDETATFTTDTVAGRIRTATLAVEPDTSYEYRLMCGGELRTGYLEPVIGRHWRNN